MAGGQAREAIEDGGGEVVSGRFLLPGGGAPFLLTK
jgi:hypothetical protein